MPETTAAAATTIDCILIRDHQSATNNHQMEKDLEKQQQEQRRARQQQENGNGRFNWALLLGNAVVQHKKMLYKHVPILTWLPQYTSTDAFGDLIAGITVALAAIPLALAFAGIAGVPTQFGLYSSFICNFIYTIFGSCKDNILGSTAIASLLTFQAAHGSWQKAALLTLLTGSVELLMGLFQLSFIIDFVSGPVSAGFTSAVALIIFTSQIKIILAVQSSGNTFIQNWLTMLQHIDDYSRPDCLLGASCVLLLILLRYIGTLRFNDKPQNHLRRSLNGCLWFLGVSRNALLVFSCAGYVAYQERHAENSPFKLVGYIPSGMPKVKVPIFSLLAVQANATLGIADKPAETFLDILHEFGSGLVVIPLIALMETIAVCKTFSKGKSVNVTQELITLGLANIATSFFQGYRVNGGLARGSINTASGGRTPMVNLYIGVIVIMALLYFAEYFYFIPKAVLAAIIISAVVFQLQYQVIVPMWKTKKSDLVPGFVAFFACLLFPLSIGVAIAITTNVLYILYNSARPKIDVDRVESACGKCYLKLTPDRCLIFPSAEYMRKVVLKSGAKCSLPVVIDCTYIYGADFTMSRIISSIFSDFQQRQQKLIFFNLRPSVAKVFEDLKLNTCYSLEVLEEELFGVEQSAEENIKEVTHL